MAVEVRNRENTLGFAQKQPFHFYSHLVILCYSRLFYVILEDIQQKHRFFSMFLPHFPRNTWAFHGFSTGFPHFLGRSLAPDLPTGQQVGLRQRTVHRLHPSPGLFSVRKWDIPGIFSDFLQNFWGFWLVFFRISLENDMEMVKW